MRIAVDAMSGDLGSSIVVEAVQKFALKHPDVEVKVFGKENELTSLKDIRNVLIENANDVMSMNESVLSVRRKKESSLVKAIVATKNDCDGVISCASTGAYYTASMLFLKRIEHIEKSCLMTILPTYSQKPTLLLDVGANANTTASQLHEFALMGHYYALKVLNIKKPKIGLLNIGAEDHKGDDIHKEAYHLLKDDSILNFVGNIESRELLEGRLDVIVCDGFSGNIALKTAEGVALILMKSLKENLMSNLKGKIGALIAKKNIYSLKDKFDYKAVGGALMMGFESPVVKAHGASDALAFENALELTYQMIHTNVVEAMKEGFEV